MNGVTIEGASSTHGEYKIHPRFVQKNRKVKYHNGEVFIRDKLAALGFKGGLCVAL